MVQSVLCLKEVFVQDVVVWYMAVVAVSHIAVRTVCPRDILRSHHMAIDTSLGLIRQIGSRVGEFENIQTQPYDRSNEDNKWHTP